MSENIVDFMAEKRRDLLEREAIAAEASDAPKKTKRIPAPDGVWEGTFFDLLRRDIPKPEQITGLGTVPVVESAKVVLYGQPSSTKTLLAFRAAIDVALEGGGVWILEGEGHEWYFRNRLERIARGLVDERQLSWQSALGDIASRVRISHKPFVLEQGLEYWKNRLSEWQPKLVLIDPLIDYTAANENDAKEMRAYLRLVQIATDQYGCAAIVCHHATKPSESGRARERGSGSIKGWADVQIAVAIDDEQRAPGRVVATARCDKGRDLSSQPGEAELRWTFTDDRIELEVLEKDDPEAQGAEQPSQQPSQSSSTGYATRRAQTASKHTQRLVTLLSRGPMTKKELRDRTGLGGKQLNDILEPLFLEERVHLTQIDRANKRGQLRPVDVVKLGAAPPVEAVSDVGSDHSDGNNDPNSQPEGISGES